MSKIFTNFRHDMGVLSSRCWKNSVISTRDARSFQSQRPASASMTPGISLKREARVFHNPGSRQRVEEIEKDQNNLYPRLDRSGHQLSCREFVKRFSKVGSDALRDSVNAIVLHGRVGAIRSAGSRLFFFDILQEGQRVQGLCNLQKLSGDRISHREFKESVRRIQRGDKLRVEGFPHRTPTGELSVLLTSLPRIVSPCLPQLPTKLEDPETRIRTRHVDLIANPKTADLLRLRCEIVQYMRQLLLNDGHIEVQTPILADCAGGAIARPFQTVATEFPGRRLNLRIAPELWLKRLIIGGFERVFEIGPSFRNEGLDATHNPEFTTCEFYRTYTDLQMLMSMTEKLLRGLAKHANQFISEHGLALDPSQVDFSGPFDCIDFLPDMETAIGRKMPLLGESNAPDELARILEDCGVPLPELPSIPQMLDRLSAHYLEPRCRAPTFIINHPECLSPLAKSFIHPTNGQKVTARAELFVNQREIVNTYEEENSPMEQRRKFLDQLDYRDSGSSQGLNESYLEALEWGLPPTGGWGGGIDRICMLMTGTPRIGDVLSFGTLKNVVALGNARGPRY